MPLLTFGAHVLLKRQSERYRRITDWGLVPKSCNGACLIIVLLELGTDTPALGLKMLRQMLTKSPRICPNMH